MKLLPLLALASALPLFADFSYTVTQKTAGPMAAMSGMGAPAVSHFYGKGGKMKLDNGSSAYIVDVDARTVTTLNIAAKTYTVRSLDDAMAVGGNMPEVKIDVKQTGQKKTVNGYMASQILMAMEMESPASRAGVGKMQVEVEFWISPDVPGASEALYFYKKNGDKFPWAAVVGGGNASMAKAVGDLQREMTKLNGVTVQQVMRIKSPGMPALPAMPQMTSAQSAQLEKARAQMEAQIAKGGPGTDMLKQALANMPGAAGPAAPAAASGAMMEITRDSSDFSGAPISDAVFAIPADYQKASN